MYHELYVGGGLYWILNSDGDIVDYWNIEELFTEDGMELDFYNLGHLY